MTQNYLPNISVVTPTFQRPTEVAALIENLAAQEMFPFELIIIDGSEPGDQRTEATVNALPAGLPFRVIYVRKTGGTAIQRNAGIEIAKGELIAFIDDDVVLEPNFFRVMAETFRNDVSGDVGGVVGYRTNHYFPAESSERWRWYKRLKLLTVYEPGRYDFKSGYPINNNMQAPFTGTREVDFMTTACAVWRREVIDSGIRFHSFFTDYGVLEDAHFSLMAGKKWRLLQSGDAKCRELNSPNGRVGARKIGYKSVVNYYFVFNEVAGPLRPSNKFRFWRFQAFEFLRVAASLFRHRRSADLQQLLGRAAAMFAILTGRAFMLQQSR